MQKITVISLGPGPRAHLTLGALEAARSARCLILRTGETDAAQYLREQGVAFETLDGLHEACEDFDAFAAAAAQRLAKAAARKSVVYAVLDALSDETVALLLQRWPGHVIVQGGGGLAHPLLQAAGARLPVRVTPATCLTVPCTQDALLVVELNTRMLAGECKLKLASWYGDEAEVLFFPPAEKETRAFARIPLCELDRQRRYDHTAAVFLPPPPLTERERCDFWDLVRVMEILRGEGGCPWDRAQTHESLSRYLIEEAYEVSEAVSEGDWDHVAEELGDVLLQVAFQANIGAQYGTFELSDVTTSICKKMIERHPRIFTEAGADQSSEESWERMKQLKRGNTTLASALRDVSQGLPALLRAEKLLKKTEALGIDAAALLGDTSAAGLLQCVREMRARGLCAEEELSNALVLLVKRVEKTAISVKNEGKCLENLTSEEICVYLSHTLERPPEIGREQQSCPG